MSWLLDELVVDALATYRITRLVVEDTITQPLRDLVESGTWLDRLIECPWCVGVWVGMGVAAARAIAPRQWTPVARGLACAAAAALIVVRVEPPS